MSASLGAGCRGEFCLPAAAGPPSAIAKSLSAPLRPTTGVVHIFGASWMAGWASADSAPGYCSGLPVNLRITLSTDSTALVLDTAWRLAGGEPDYETAPARSGRDPVELV